MKKYIIPALAVLLVILTGLNIWQYAKAQQKQSRAEDRYVTVFLWELEDTCDGLESFLHATDATKENTAFVTQSMWTLQTMLESHYELYREPFPNEAFRDLGIVYSGGSFSSEFAVENIWDDGTISEAERQFTSRLLEVLKQIRADVSADMDEKGRLEALRDALTAFCQTMEDKEKSPYALISNTSGR